MKTFKYIILIFTLLLVKIANSQTNEIKKIKHLFENNKIKSTKINIPDKSYPANACFNISVLITTLKNKEIKLEGKDCLKHFNVSISGATIDTFGLIKVTNIKSLIKHSIIVTAKSKYNLSYSVTDTIKINFKGILKLLYNGTDGEVGENGKFGADGVKRSNLASDGHYGMNGASGQDGAPGQNIEISVTSIFDSVFNKNLLNVNVKSNTTLSIENYLMDPDSGYAIISTNGGNGGEGGSGGDGGDGVDGVCKSGYDGYGTQGGQGGHGGMGGAGGSGGKIFIVFDSLCINNIQLFSLINVGGIGGKGGVSGDHGHQGQNYFDGNPSITNENRFKFNNGLKGKDGCKGAEPTIKILNLNKK